MKLLEALPYLVREEMAEPQIIPKGYRIERDSRFYTQSGILKKKENVLGSV